MVEAARLATPGSKCEWYDVDALKNKTADYLRSKLEIYYLTSTPNASQYINNVLTPFLELNKIPG